MNLPTKGLIEKGLKPSGQKRTAQGRTRLFVTLKAGTHRSGEYWLNLRLDLKGLAKRAGAAIKANR